MDASVVSKAKILFVEDNEVYRKAVKVALEADKFEVAEAENGKIASGLIKTFLPQVVVCDIYMPEMDGLTFLTASKKDPQLKDIPFIMLTNVQEEIDHSVQLGADEAVFKASVTPRQIGEICTAHLSRLQNPPPTTGAPSSPATMPS